MNATITSTEFRELCDKLIAKVGYSPASSGKFTTGHRWAKILLYGLSATSSIVAVESQLDINKFADWLDKRATIYCIIMGAAVDSSVCGMGGCNGNNWIFCKLGNIRFVICYEAHLLRCVVSYSDEAGRAEAEAFIRNVPVVKQKKKDSFSIICHNGDSFYTQAASIKHAREFDFEFYADDFFRTHNSINEWLKGEKTGLSLLYGSPGQGKTYYLRHLITQYENCVYMPPHLVNQASSPSFIPFLMSLPPSIYIIEDAEELVTASQNRSAGLQNLLNASDGLLSESIRGQFILTFNTEIKNVDKALLRGGRNVINYEFKPLDAIRADAALIKLGKTPRGRSLSIGEIFNDEPENSQALKGASQSHIGFHAIKH